VDAIDACARLKLILQAPRMLGQLPNAVTFTNPAEPPVVWIVCYLVFIGPRLPTASPCAWCGNVVPPSRLTLVEGKERVCEGCAKNLV
jgi:hypothetical protein